MSKRIRFIKMFKKCIFFNFFKSSFFNKIDPIRYQIIIFEEIYLFHKSNIIVK